MNTLLKASAAAAVLVGVAACASQPEPEPVAETPAPVEEPAPVETVEAAPAAPVYSGPAPGSLEDFQVNVGERVYFDLDQSRLDGDDQEILNRQAAWLASYPGFSILVAGNCDERGTREYNLALGERRAAVVKDYLVSLGVDSSRIETISYGKERPLDASSNEAAWARNRNGFTQVLDATAG
ncbi:MAG: peptidoglycan-associated lipoprotein Pal [Pseudomonadota bacterium]